MPEKGEKAFDSVIEEETEDTNANEGSETSEDTVENTDSTTTEQQSQPDSSESSNSVLDDDTKTGPILPENSNTDDDSDETPNQKTQSSPSEVPAFPYDVVEQKPLYIRPDTWSVIEDLRLYTKVRLQENHGVRNGETREIDEAIVSLINEKISATEVADELITNRKQE